MVSIAREKHGKARASITYHRGNGPALPTHVFVLQKGLSLCASGRGACGKLTLPSCRIELSVQVVHARLNVLEYLIKSV